MKPLVLYHGRCVDGSGAAYAAWCEFGADAQYRAVVHGDEPPSAEEVSGRDVYLLDFIYPKHQVEWLAGICCLTIIDHHETTARALGDAKYLRFDANHSGAVLAWKYFHPHDEMPEVFYYMEDRDLWRWKLPFSREISAALEAHGARTDFRVIEKFIVTTYKMRVPPQMVFEGDAVYRAQRQYTEAIASFARRVRLGVLDESGSRIEFSLDVMAVATPVLQSEVGVKLAGEAADWKKVPVGVAYYFDGPRGCYHVSLRSVGDFDVSAIARRFGGAGHRNAAGFECRTLPWCED